jgi:DNA-directed RNA polymerase subunit K/omega
MSDIEDDDVSIVEEDSIDDDAYVDPDDENEEYSDYESDEEIFKDEEEVLTNDVKIIIKVPDNERRTTNILSQYEFAKIIGLRAQQIANGDTNIPVIFVDADEIINSTSIEKEREIAEKEIREKRCPYKVRKQYQQGNKVYYEDWDVNHMIII